MNFVICIFLMFVGCIFGRAAGRRLVLSMVAALTLNSALATAASIPPPTISISVSSVLGYSVFRASAIPSPYSFGATVEWPKGAGFPGKTDIYFGVIPPEKDKIFTWAAGGSVATATDGLAPIARGVTGESFNISSFLGQEIQYTFTGKELPGMYLVFALLVVSDTDPSNTQNWVGINMVPLIFQP